MGYLSLYVPARHSGAARISVFVDAPFIALIAMSGKINPPSVLPFPRLAKTPNASPLCTLARPLRRASNHPGNTAAQRTSRRSARPTTRTGHAHHGPSRARQTAMPQPGCIRQLSRRMRRQLAETHLPVPTGIHRYCTTAEYQRDCDLVLPCRRAGQSTERTCHKIHRRHSRYVSPGSRAHTRSEGDRRSKTI
jgi:hypothetical protein